MKCPNCGNRFKLPVGDSNRPGVFFFIAVVAWGATALSAALSWSPWQYFIGLIAVFPTIAVLPAIWDQTTYGPVTCKQCGARQRILPWSL